VKTIGRITKHRALGLGSAVLAIGLLAGPATTSAASQVVVNGHCSGHSASVLTVAHENGRISIEFEVDQNVVGKTWRIALRDNTLLVWAGSAVTAAPDGSLTVMKLTTDRTGLDHIAASARNPVTGETCSAAAAV
jgi:hypothetical protein